MQLQSAYAALNVAMRGLLDDQGTLANNNAPAAAAAPASTATPLTDTTLGFETIDEEIRIVYSAIAKVSKVMDRVSRRSNDVSANPSK